MRSSFQSFTSAYKIATESVSYSDYVVARLFYEAARDAGFWNIHWTITNMPPNSDRIWSQWKSVQELSFLTPTASAECDELSALYAFLVGRAGFEVSGYSGHTRFTQLQFGYCIRPKDLSFAWWYRPRRFSRHKRLVCDKEVRPLAAEIHFRIHASRRPRHI